MSCPKCNNVSICRRGEAFDGVRSVLAWEMRGQAIRFCPFCGTNLVATPLEYTEETTRGRAGGESPLLPEGIYQCGDEVGPLSKFVAPSLEWTREKPTQPGLYWIYCVGLWPSMHVTVIQPNATPLFNGGLCWRFYDPREGEVLASIEEVMAIEAIRCWQGPLSIEKPEPPKDP